MRLKAGILMGALLLGLATAPAMAADKGGIPDPASMVDTKSRWTGCYLGILGSYQMQSTEIGGLVNFDANDIGYGISGGCDARLPDTNIVVGLMGSYSASNVGNALVDVDSSWDVLGRAGFIIGHTTLVYGLAGYTSIDGGFTVPVAFGLPDSGLTYGIGVETFVTKHLALKAELMAIDLGSTAGGLLENSMTAGRVGLNWRF